jgi:hypothetical protein
VRAAVDGQRRGLVDHWLHPIREINHDHRHELDAIGDEVKRLNRLCELNVIRQVRNLASDVFVQDAVNDATLPGLPLTVIVPLSWIGFPRTAARFGPTSTVGGKLLNANAARAACGVV